LKARSLKREQREKVSVCVGETRNVGIRRNMAFLISVSGGSARSTVLRTSTKPNGIEGARGVSRASVKMSAETGEVRLELGSKARILE